MNDQIMDVCVNASVSEYKHCDRKQFFSSVVSSLLCTCGRSHSLLDQL